MILPRTPASPGEPSVMDADGSAGREAPEAAPVFEKPPISETLLREISIVDRAPRSLPESFPMLMRSPFLPLSLTPPGDARANRAMPGAAPAPPPYALPVIAGRELGAEFAFSESPAPALFSTIGAAALAPSRGVPLAERLTLPSRLPAPADFDGGESRAPEMPLPPRDRTAAAAASSGGNLLVQRSDLGSAPAGAQTTGADPSEPSAQSQSADHTAEPDSGGANDVNLLAGEVWALLRRRLAYEAERMGR